MVLWKKEKQKSISSGARLCIGLIVWYVIAAILVGFLKFPKLIMYIGDLINLWTFLNAVKRKGTMVAKNGVLLFIVLFALESVISGIVNLKVPQLLLWGIRQNFRFFIFYYSCTVFMKREDYDTVFSIVKILFWISFPLCVYEALIVTYPAGVIVGDYVGGIYYGIQGVNAPLNVLLIIHSTKTLIDYYERRTKLSYLLLVLSAAMAMAAMAELKIFLIEIVIIAIVVMVSKGISWKSIFLCLFGLMSIGIVMQAFVNFNGGGRSYYTTDYLSLTGMLTNALRESGYDGTGDLNRFFAIQTLTEMFFKRDLAGFLLGIGLGNAEYASFSFLTSAFYNAYNWLHYQYFSISFVFIENGMVGIILYFGIFISAAIQGRKYLKKDQEMNVFYIIMIIMMVIMIFYNPALRNEQCGFLLYMMLALPMVVKKISN